MTTFVSWFLFAIYTFPMSFSGQSSTCHVFVIFTILVWCSILHLTFFLETYPLQNVLTTQGAQNTLHFQGGQYCLEIVIQPLPLSEVLFFKLFIKPTQLWFIPRGGGRRDAPSCWRADSCYPSDFRCHCWFISISFRTSLFTFLSNWTLFEHMNAFHFILCLWCY